MPLLSTSLNVSGEDFVTDFHVAKQHPLTQGCDFIWDLDKKLLGKESTLIDCTSPKPTEIRKGYLDVNITDF
ncbi:MAG: Sua5/YciO/YrdC/YwlC family protein [Candidatus Margulisbacteria bacterium]|nr:Sua5/YciO/YrdC/YwlC family protein [Candidatus Margulisiibacteriota bacterium]